MKTQLAFASLCHDAAYQRDAGIFLHPNLSRVCVMDGEVRFILCFHSLESR